MCGACCRIGLTIGRFLFMDGEQTEVLKEELHIALEITLFGLPSPPFPPFGSPPPPE